MLLELLSMGCASAPVPPVEVTAACPGPRGALVSVGDRAGTVRIVDVDRGLTVRTLVGESLPVTAFDWSAEGRTLGVVQETARATTTSVWDVDSGTRRFVDSDPVAGSGSFVLALDDAGEHVLTWGRSTALRVRSTCDEAAFAPPTI
jgi:WD40 repeat protein